MHFVSVLSVIGFVDHYLVRDRVVRVIWILYLVWVRVADSDGGIGRGPELGVFRAHGCRRRRDDVGSRLFHEEPAEGVVGATFTRRCAEEPRSERKMLWIPDLLSL